MPSSNLTHSRTSVERLADRAVSKIVFTYAAFAGLWILLSDQIVVALFSDPRTIALVSTIKGWLFVAVTSFLLAVMMRRHLNRLVDSHNQLQKGEERWKFAIEGAGDGVWDWNFLTGEAHFSKRWKEIIGYAESEIEDNAAEWKARVHPEDMPSVMSAIQAHIDGKTPLALIEFRMLCKDASWKWILGRGMVISRDTEGNPLRLVGTNTDIADRKQAESVLKASEEKYRALVETTGTGYLILDKEGKVIDANSEYVRLTGYSDLREILGRSVLEWTAEYEIERSVKAVAQCVRDGFISNIVIEYVDRNGRTTPIEINATIIGEGDSVQIISLCRDITERKQAEDQVRQLAFHDALTKLPNRRLLDDRLRQAMAGSKRRGCYGAVMFLDLDNFKPLNDLYGHRVGDMLLVEVADRLKSCIREMDTVARFGGDEFVVIVSELAADESDSISQATVIAEKIRLALSEPYRLTVRLDGKSGSTVEHHCTVTIGVALFINHESSQDDILKWADAAMYEAKAAGRNMIRFYAPQTD
jgi:diguanylate cyclase (GGDEF)-like protein/PAS domain S-box-containing protein